MSDPLLVDQIQIEPGSTGTRLISKDSSTTALSLSDPVSGDLTLADMVGLQKTGSLYFVGATAPATYTTIQAALDAVPVSSSKTTPSLVLVSPGVYSEALTVEKDGIILTSLGAVTIKAPSAGSTITFQQGGSSTPKYFRMESIRVENEYDGEACVELVGGSASEVAEEWIELINCDLVATGIGGYPVSAATVNKIRIQGGNWSESSSNSLLYIEQAAELLVSGVAGIYNSQLIYDQANPAPSIATSTYRYENCRMTGNVLVTLTTLGALEISNCVLANLTCNGDRIVTANSSVMDDVVVNGTVAASLRNCVRGAASGAGTLAESTQTGTVAFAASSSETVTHAVEQPDTNYQVFPETELTEPVAVQSKTTTTFVLAFSGAQTTSVGYTIVRTQF